MPYRESPNREEIAENSIEELTIKNEDLEHSLKQRDERVGRQVMDTKM